MSRRTPVSPRKAFTLVELLVVMGIISMLIGMMLPAVQSAREAARRMQCTNHLKQMALAFQSHASLHGHYPSGGWGWSWVGDPDCGYGKEQPGSWVYNILPFIEQESLRNLGVGLPYSSAASGNQAIKEDALRQLITIPISILYCPSRRPARLYPLNPVATANLISPLPDTSAKTDYAVSAGDTSSDVEPAFPRYWSELKDFDWPAPKQNGIVFQCSMITPAQVTDGTSYTYCVGEKYMMPQHYFLSRESLGDNESVYSGSNLDHIRSTGNPPRMDTPDFDDSLYQFGSAHAAGFNMSFCDGSVRTISYDINPETHRYLGTKDDGIALDSDEYY